MGESEDAQRRDSKKGGQIKECNAPKLEDQTLCSKDVVPLEYSPTCLEKDVGGRVCVGASVGEK